MKFVVEWVPQRTFEGESLGVSGWTVSWNEPGPYVEVVPGFTHCVGVAHLSGVGAVIEQAESHRVFVLKNHEADTS